MTVDEYHDGITQTWTDKLINVILCRGDLAKQKLEAKPVPLKELFRYSSKKDKIYIALGSILAVLVGVMQSTTSIIGGYQANLYLKDHNHIGNAELLYASLIFCATSGFCGIIMALLSYSQSYFFMAACSNIIRKTQSEYVKAVLRQDSTWLDANDSGLISSQLNNNIERIRDSIADKMGLIIRGFANFLFSSFISFVINWRVTVATIALGPLGAITMGLMGRLSASPMKALLKATGEAGAIAEESIMNFKTVAACNGQRTMVDKYSNVLSNSLSKAVRVYFFNGFFEGLMFLELYILYAAALAYGIVSYFNGDFEEPGSVLVAANCVQLGGYFLSLLGPHMMAILKARVAASVIYETIDREPAIDTGDSSGVPLTKCEGNIVFEDVHFKYPTRSAKILNGCSWEAKSGETIAFVGHSGCGKSTSIGLLTRLYNKCSGTIKIDDTEIEKLSVKDLRKAIGIVQQEPCLFNGTIRENIAMGRHFSDKKIEESARIANAHDFICKLEKGYDTLIGVGGISLSGGQKQRIAISRAIAGDPKILLLDEATSALDTESEKIVQMALTKASKGRTTIMIAHRLSTLKDVKRIHVINKGTVVEIGSHYDLIQLGGIYAQLAKAQEVGLLAKRSRHQSSSSDLPPQPMSAVGSLRESMRSNVMEGMKAVPVPSHSGNDQEKKTSIPLLRLLTSTENGWLKIATFLSCFIRGLELPSFSYFFMLPYMALQSTKDTYHPWLLASTISYLVIGFLSCFFITSAVGFGGWASEKVVNSLKIKTLKSLLNRDAAYFDDRGRSPAECVASLALHSPNVQACLDYRFVLLSNNLVSLIICLILTFASCWQTGCASVALIFCFVALLFGTSSGLTKVLRRKEREDATAECAIEIFNQVRTIQLLSVEDYFIEKYQKQQDIAAPLDSRVNMLHALTFTATLSFVMFSDMVCFGVGNYMVYKGQVSSASAYVAATVANIAGWAVMFAAPTFTDIVKANASARILFNMIDHTSDSSMKEDLRETPEIAGDVSVEKVYFAYPTRPANLVAKSLNLRAKPGQAIALVGASGCGKSTIIQLLERFYPPRSGAIKMDGNDISEISLNYLRQNIALVGQEPVLFRGSIAENIGLGCDGITMEDIRHAAETANAARFIEAFPMGYDTDVGEKGRSLSGGQKQRIAIARALVRDPKVILLDEATSALDTESEQKVQKALNDASTGRTSITIAHRLSTIRKADRIYFIENGSVVEYGTHDELIESDGKYARLVAAQALQPE